VRTLVFGTLFLSVLMTEPPSLAYPCREVVAQISAFLFDESNFNENFSMRIDQRILDSRKLMNGSFFASSLALHKLHSLYFPAKGVSALSSFAPEIPEEQLRFLQIRSVRIWPTSNDQGSLLRYRVDVYSGMNFIYLTQNMTLLDLGQNLDLRSQPDNFHIIDSIELQVLQGGQATRYQKRATNSQDPLPLANLDAEFKPVPLDADLESAKRY
jgi:hypothetical protein